MRVAHDAQRLVRRRAARAPRREQRVVGEHGAHAAHDAAVPVTQPVHVLPGRLAGYPLRLAGVGGDLPVERHGVLERDVGRGRAYVVEEHLVYRRALGLQHLLRDGYAVRAQYLHAPARDQRVRVAGADHDPRYARSQYRVRARRLPAVVTAGLERDVHRRAPRLCAAARQGVSLGVRLAAALVPALAYYLAVLDYHRADHGVGRAPALAPFCQLQRAAHVVFVVHNCTSKQESPEDTPSGLDTYRPGAR